MEECDNIVKGKMIQDQSVVNGNVTSYVWEKENTFGGESTKFTVDQETNLSFDLMSFEEESPGNRFEAEIRALEDEIEGIGKGSEEALDVQLDHFCVKRGTQEEGNLIFVQADCLSPGTLDNLHTKFQGQYEWLKADFQLELDRLTNILLDRDNEIAYLKSQSQSPLSNRTQINSAEAFINTDLDINNLMTQHSNLMDSNKAQSQKINELSSEIEQLKVSSLAPLRMEADSAKRPSIQIVKVQANRGVAPKDNVSLGSSATSNALKETTSLEIQTDPFDNIPNNKQLLQDLDIISEQNSRLGNALDIIEREFQSLKTDNILLLEDVHKGRMRAEELEKIVLVQRDHIEEIRKETRTDEGEGEGNKRIRISDNSVERLQSENNQLRQVVDGVKRELEDYRNERKHLLNQIHGLTEGCRNAIAERDHVAVEAQELNFKLNQTVKENDSLRSEIKVLEGYVQNMNAQKQQMAMQAEQLKGLLNEANAVEQEWNDKKIQLEMQITDKEQLLNKLKTDNEFLKLKNQDMSNQHRSLQQKLHLSEQQSLEKAKKISEFETQVKQLERQIKQIQVTQETQQKQRQETQEKHKNAGAVGFGTSVTLVEKSPRKIPQTGSYEEIISTAKDLLRSSEKPENTQLVYSLLEMITEGFEKLRFEREQWSMSPISKGFSNTNTKDLSVFEQETNVYIETLLRTISEHETEADRLRGENNKIRSHMDRMSLSYLGEDNKEWEEVVNELQFERRLTEKLSEHVKILKEEVFSLSNEVERKNEQILFISNRAPRDRKYDLREIDSHLGSIQNEYQRLLSASRGRMVQTQSARFSQNNGVLLDEIEQYRLELEKAVNFNEYLKNCLTEDKVCVACLEYEQVVRDLEKRLENYEGIMMGELKRIYTSCEREINQKGREQLHMKIENLRDKSQSRPSERGFQIPSSKKPDLKSPSVRKYTNLSVRGIHRRHIVLDHLVQTERLSLECILVVMIKILEQADNDKLYLQQQPILPENVEIIRFDNTEPEKIMVEISEDRASGDPKARVYMAPERLRGGEPSKRALVWNIGLIFHFLVNKKMYFIMEREVADAGVRYRYENKLLPELKGIIEPMLEKEPSRRALFQHTKQMINHELTRLKIQNSRR